jgi:Rps23 Pro-64 3,4-dihydroxylase Tpa1-like proline 4-hydroxylase|tara:strand:+ start:2792 stop:3304 length:513 start_codon:yes stop_codon:yes gene_type:complete
MMIQKYDNFLSPDTCGMIYNYILSSLFRIGWEDSGETQHRSHPNLFSSYSFKDVQKLKILHPILDKLKNKNITIDNYDKCIVNLTKPLDVNFCHVHPKQIVALHYSSLTWNPEWGGETIFYENNKKDIKYCSPYTPNRLIIFDGSIPHTIKAQNILGPAYRFTTSIFFNC